MQEIDIAKSILDRINERLMNLQRTSSASSVSVRIGEFRKIDPSGLFLAFNSLRQDYESCKGCALHLELIEARAFCMQGHEFKAKVENGYRCPDCGGAIGTLISGEELDITKIVVSGNGH